VVSLIFWIGNQYPIRHSPPASADFYETDYWDLGLAEDEPLDIDNISTSVITHEIEATQVALEQWQFTYLSEEVNSAEVRIHSTVTRQVNQTGTQPAILILHGYGSSSSTFMGIMNDLAAHGIVAMAIDAPDSGQSTAYPPLNSDTFLDVSEGPESAHLYHSVWSAARAVTLLDSLPFVSDMIVAGGSMGGMQSIILSAIDARIDGTIPMISAGNLDESLRSGTFLNSLFLPDEELDSETINDAIKWFDPIAYARELTAPVLMFAGTNDPFFPLLCIHDTIHAISAPLTLSLLPNAGHFIDSTWTSVIIEWVDSVYRNGGDYPSITVTQREELTLYGWTLRISANVTGDLPLSVCWRTGDPGSPWQISEMERAPNGFVFDLTPTHIGRISFFVSGMRDGIIYTSSEIHIARGGSFVVPLISLLSGLGLAVISKMTGWHPTLGKTVRELPILVGVIMMVSGFLLPYFGISRRVEISLLDFMEIFGNFLGLSGWFLSVIIILFSLIIALSSTRHGTPLQLTVVVWIPILIALSFAYFFFAGVFAVSGELLTVYAGPATFLLLLAVPVMLILEALFRKYWHLLSSHLRVPENLSS
ncbi:MAG: alpha/beta hydrolase, partial [Candidatus Thorarchaeota archaeon]